MTPGELGKLFPISLAKPDPHWTDHFNAEKGNIQNTIGPNIILSIEHIGSTAIPDLVSKPCIDVLIEIKEKTDIQQMINKLKGLNYHYIPKPENPPPHMMFAKGYTKKGFKGQAFHLHIRFPGDRDEIYFRDYLRENPETASEYAILKLKLTEKFRNDREEYTEAKTDFIKRITELARKEN